MAYDNTNSGAIFKAEKEKDDDRDYSGSLNVEGTEFWVSFVRQSKKSGAKFLSLKVKRKDGQQAGSGSAQPSLRDDVGF